MKSKEQKRKEAVVRQEAHNKLTVAEKIQKCLNRGGSKRELERLMK